jgi:hypothetical protein
MARKSSRETRNASRAIRSKDARPKVRRALVPEDLWTRLVKLREARAFDTSISICQQALLHCSKKIEPKWWRALKAELARPLWIPQLGSQKTSNAP